MRRMTQASARLLVALTGGAAILGVLAHGAQGAGTAADAIQHKYKPIAILGHPQGGPVAHPITMLPATSNAKTIALPPGAQALPGTMGARPLPVPPVSPPRAITASPALLPPLPGNGRVVPPPPALAGVEPVAPLAPASESPQVEGPPPGTSSVRIYSDFVRYDRQSKQAIAQGHVKIFQDDTVISTTEAHYDQANKITTILVPFELVQQKPHKPKTTLKGDAMTVYHQQRHVVVVGDVKLLREGDPTARPTDSSTHAKLKAAFKRDATVVDSDHMDYYTNTKDAQFDGNVKFYQKEKNATGDHAYLDNAHHTMTMDGDVVLTQIKGDWLTKAGVVDTSKPDPQRDEALRNKTVITGDHLVVDETTNDAVMTGQIVTVVQKGKKATGQRAEYDDRGKTITLTGNVRIAKEDGGYLTADKAVFHTNTNKFEAYGTQGHQVETDFSLPGGSGP